VPVVDGKHFTVFATVGIAGMRPSEAIALAPALSSSRARAGVSRCCVALSPRRERGFTSTVDVVEDKELAAGSGREVPCLMHVAPDETAANRVGAFHRGPDVTKVCGPRVVCHHKHHRGPAAADRPAPVDARRVAAVKPNRQLGNRSSRPHWGR